MTARLFLGPVGAELIGSTREGVPVAADAKGVGEMVEVTGVFEALGFNPEPWQCWATGITKAEGES